MTPLKTLILQLLKKSGPMNDLEIWAELKDFSSMVVIACLELQEAGLIEATPNDPNLWQLSEKGIQFVSDSLRAEVDK